MLIVSLVLAYILIAMLLAFFAGINDYDMDLSLTTSMLWPLLFIVIVIQVFVIFTYELGSHFGNGNKWL